MLTIALAAMLQFGSCQASPDRSRTATEAADIFFKGIEERDETPLWWVVRLGASFQVDGQTYSDREFYTSLEADTSPQKNLVIVGLTATRTMVAATTIYQGGADTLTMTTLRFADGCITAVTVDHDPTPAPQKGG